MLNAMTTAFTPHPDFDRSSYKQQCPVTGIGKQKAGLGVQPHDVDNFILRGPEIIARDGSGEWSLGFFDIRKAAVQHAAEQHLGMVKASTYAKARQERNHYRSELESARSEIESLRAQVNSLVLGNAELITQVSGRDEEIERLTEEGPGDDEEEDRAAAMTPQGQQGAAA